MRINPYPQGRGLHGMMTQGNIRPKMTVQL